MPRTRCISRSLAKAKAPTALGESEFRMTRALERSTPEIRGIHARDPTGRGATVAPRGRVICCSGPAASRSLEVGNEVNTATREPDSIRAGPWRDLTCVGAGGGGRTGWLSLAGVIAGLESRTSYGLELESSEKRIAGALRSGSPASLLGLPKGQLESCAKALQLDSGGLMRLPGRSTCPAVRLPGFEVSTHAQWLPGCGRGSAAQGRRD